ncbi:Replication factor C subunit 5 [Camellia lanceoleosa]|uniref:Replication factor C subunit 5 n=1 Tax=Camellia lanceoleosa TaxID=1840588 RepID=A0ACC0G618_9ERIC|nr:Replication factor C subunit 5 [Camellia lanceoleosa]
MAGSVHSHGVGGGMADSKVYTPIGGRSRSARLEMLITTTQHSIRDANNPARGDLDRVPFKGYGNYCRLGPDARDEADAMTKDAQFALRRVIEKYTKSTRFALIYNHVNKIIPALQSGCIRFQFAPLDAINVSERLKHVIQAERLDVPECGLKALVRLSNGGMRKALNILQDDVVIQFINPKVQASIAANTWVVSGSPQTKSIFSSLSSR